MLVEIQGQFEGRGLLDVSTHLGHIDRAAGHDEVLGKLAGGWDNWLQAQRNLAEAKRELEKARAEEEWLRDAVEQLDLLAPQPGEEEELSGERERLANVGRIGEGIAVADDAIFGDSGAQAVIGRARAALDRAAPFSGGLLDEAQAALARADAELAEAGAAVSSAGHELESDPARLQAVDDRLHELRQQARKHDCEPDALAEVHSRLAASLAGIEDPAGALAGLADNERQWRDYYQQVAAVVAANRAKAATALDAAVTAELPPLKLDGASFGTAISDLPPEQYGRHGTQQARFRGQHQPRDEGRPDRPHRLRRRAGALPAGAEGLARGR